MQKNAIRGRKILDKKNIQHFILPENGHLMDDHLINKSFSEIIQKYLIDQRLPFPIISIEFDTNDSDLPKDEVKNLKTLIIAQEHKEPDESSSEKLPSKKILNKKKSYWLFKCLFDY